MTKTLKRIYGRGHFHFITFSCYQRLPLLGESYARDLFLEELAKLKAECGFLVLGYVVMPEHVHLLISELDTRNPSSIVQMLKQRVSHKMRESRPGLCGHLRRFWQVRFFDFNVYSSEKKIEKLKYIHANPVSRGLVKDSKDWIWSSWGFYLTGVPGIVPVDLV
jgi:putative transposase